jgi:rhodanese-related sulfurtransferase
MKGTIAFFIVLVISAFWTRVLGQAPAVNEITPQAVLEKIKSEAPIVVVDVRTAQEFKGELGHIPCSILVPLQDIEAKPDTLARYKEKEIIAVCRSGRRSLNAATILTAKGFKVKSMSGGMTEWNRLKYPVKK